MTTKSSTDDKYLRRFESSFMLINYLDEKKIIVVPSVAFNHVIRNCIENPLAERSFNNRGKQ
jgi:hypothetical protein